MEKAFDFYCDEVLTGKTKVSLEYESSTVLAFNHTKPQYTKHIVIIPKKHIKSLTDIQPDDYPLLLEMITVAKNLIIKQELEKNGVRLITNMGKFQDSPHLHFHITSGDKL